MVIGLYYITECHDELESANLNFVDFNEAQIAYESSHIGLQTPINVRVGDLAGSPEMHSELKGRFSELITDEPVDGSKLIQTTLGRMHFNSILPKDFPYVQASVRKPEMKKIISEVIQRYNKAELRIFLDSMKSVGFKYGAKAGLTVAMNDVKTPPNKNQILEKYEIEAEKVEKLFKDDIITETERKQKIIEIWNEATDQVQYACLLYTSPSPRDRG